MEAFPWPPAQDDEILPAYVRTWKESVLHPHGFFSALPRDLRTRDALFYFLPLAIAAAGIHLFWHMIAVGIGGVEMAERLGVRGGWGPLLDFLFSPVLALIGWWIFGFCVHAVLSLTHGSRIGFAGTLRVIAFAYGPAVFAIVPGLGDAAAAVWMLVLVVIGLREAHRTVWWKAVTATAVPLFVLTVLAGIAMLVARAAEAIGATPLS